jgi:hypothetical protein
MLNGIFQHILESKGTLGHQPTGLLVVYTINYISHKQQNHTTRDRFGFAFKSSSNLTEFKKYKKIMQYTTDNQSINR